MKTVYLAGPMTGKKLGNFPAFDEAAACLRKQGWHVLSPADFNRIAGLHEFREGMGVVKVDERFRTEMIGTDISHIDKADAIALLSGWEQSEGTFGELTFARLKGIPVLDAQTGRPLRWAEVWRCALNCRMTAHIQGDGIVI